MQPTRCASLRVRLMHEPLALSEQDQYLVEVVFIDPLTQVDIVALNGSFANPLRQIEQRTQTVFAFARDAHRW